MEKLVILLSIVYVVSAKIALSPKALRCICEVESHCQKDIGCTNISKPNEEFECEEELGCHPDLDSLVMCGAYHITEEYWIQCGKPGDGFRACANDMACAERCINNYMERWAGLCTLFTREPTDMDMIRIHNGGPKGCQSYATVEYWNKVKPCCTKGEGNCTVTEEENDTEVPAEDPKAAAVFSVSKAGKLAPCWYMMGLVLSVVELVFVM